MRSLLVIAILAALSGTLLSQSDTLDEYLKKNSLAIDTLKLKIKEVVCSGNKVTKDEIILREMQLKKGGTFTLRDYTNDILSIYNLGLFTKVDILPVPVSQKEIVLNVDVQERWYILPLPSAGIDDGEWKKIWVGLNLRWDNFRGRNETADLRLRFFYNPSVSFSYSVPWIGENLHLFASYSVGYSRTRNQSLIAIGRPSEGNTISYNESNYDNLNFNTSLQVGKYMSRKFSLFTIIGYNYTRTTEWAPGRTINPNGKDKFLSLGFGLGFDSRDIHEYATKGYYSRTTYTRYKDIDIKTDYGRFAVESQAFVPIYLGKEYYLTAASRLYTSMAIGENIPVYDHEYLGYGDNFVRGWGGVAYEGEGALTLYNELRIPIISPRYIKAKKLFLVRDIPVIKNLDLRHGLFFTLLYDVGTVFNHDENIWGKKFQAGAGMGLNFIAPFGYVFRADWAFRLQKPVVGQIILSLYAKF